jgi:hypothetical protein
MPGRQGTLRLIERLLLRKYGVSCLYSVQHVGNLASIEQHGILSRNRVVGWQNPIRIWSVRLGQPSGTVSGGRSSPGSSGG